MAAFRDRMELMVELLVDRVAAVRNGVEYMESTGWATVPIPDGAAIFVTAGPWENYATPRAICGFSSPPTSCSGFLCSYARTRVSSACPGRSATQVDDDLAAAWDEGDATLVRLRPQRWLVLDPDPGFLQRLGAFETAYNRTTARRFVGRPRRRATRSPPARTARPPSSA